MSKVELNDSGDDSNQKEVEPEVSSEFVETLYGLPIVNDSINTFKNYTVGRLTFAGARRVSGLAKPVSDKFTGQLEFADKMAANSVRQLSSHFPIFQQPTDKIIDTLKEPAIQTFSTVKQYHEQLGCTIGDNITTPGSRFVMDVDSKLAPLVNKLEDYLQKVVPYEEGTTGSRDVQDNQQEIAQTLRALQIAVATGDRCVDKIRNQLSTTQSYTAEQLKQLHDSSQLLSKATDTVSNLNQTLIGVVGSLRETVQLHTHLQNLAAVFKDEENLPKAVQAKIVAYSHALLEATDAISAYITTNAKQFPEFFQGRLKPLATFFGENYGCVVEEIKNGKGTPLEKAKNILNLTTTQTIPLLRNSLTELHEAIPRYTNSLNTSIYNTRDALKSQLQILNVK